MNAEMCRRGKDWTREETIVALGLYFQIPHGKIHARNLDIVTYARLIGRTPGALSMKMCNLARFDTKLVERGLTGLPNGGAMDKTVWDEFSNHPDVLATEWERVLRSYNAGESGKVEGAIDFVHSEVSRGETSSNQAFFRSSVLAAYNNKCCITGINLPELLIADHIKPVANCTEECERVDVENGLCLSPLYSRAFQCGLMTIDTQYHIVLSKSLKGALSAGAFEDLFLRYDNSLITLPRRARPGRKFLEYHNDYVFQG